MSKLTKVAIFASGSGTNAEKIISNFYLPTYSRVATIELLVSDNPDAYALCRAQSKNIATAVIPRADFRSEGEEVLKILAAHDIDYIVLAGFLSLVPPAIIEKYRGRIINIHPALLPQYGGKGMYGDNVHRAVIANKECQSGITIHHVDENFDEGSTIISHKVKVTARDTPESLAGKIHKLEYRHFSPAIRREIESIRKKKL